MAKSKSKSTPVGQAPISQDPEAVLALEKWCMEQRGRRKVSDLHNSTDEFVKYSSQSLAKKMGLIWDKLWGQGSTGPSDTTEKNLAADALMSAARSGIGIGGTFVCFLIQFELSCLTMRFFCRKYSFEQEETRSRRP